MPCLHVICRAFLHVKKIDETSYESGYWPVSEEYTNQLIGGMLFLHETKSERSYYGGTVKSFRKSGPESPHPGRMIFIFQPTADARGQRWRGQDDPMSWVGGVVRD